MYPQSATILEPGSLYTGAKFFFGTEENKKNHIKIIKEENTSKNDVKPESLTEAIKFFIVGVAQGLINNEHKKKKTRSMLIHPSVNRPVHKQWHGWVTVNFKDITKLFILKK